MRSVAVICNIVLFAFICLVLAVDGLPTEASYIVFTVWALMTLILSPAVISRRGAGDGWLGLPAKSTPSEEQRKIDDPSPPGTAVRTVTIICNIVFLAHFCWAFVDQYPHPEEEGFIPFAVLMVLTPILNLVALFCGGAGAGWFGLRMKRRTS